MSNGRAALILYRRMLRAAETLPNYNFRIYAQRKIRDAFRANSKLKDRERIEQEMELAKENLKLIIRQGIVGQLYRTKKCILEVNPALSNKKTRRKVF